MKHIRFFAICLCICLLTVTALTSCQSHLPDEPADDKNVDKNIDDQIDDQNDTNQEGQGTNDSDLTNESDAGHGTPDQFLDDTSQSDKSDKEDDYLVIVTPRAILFSMDELIEFNRNPSADHFFFGGSAEETLSLLNEGSVFSRDSIYILEPVGNETYLPNLRLYSIEQEPNDITFYYTYGDTYDFIRIRFQYYDTVEEADARMARIEKSFNPTVEVDGFLLVEGDYWLFYRAGDNCVVSYQRDSGMRIHRELDIPICTMRLVDISSDTAAE